MSSPFFVELKLRLRPVRYFPHDFLHFEIFPRLPIFPSFTFLRFVVSGVGGEASLKPAGITRSAGKSASSGGLLMFSVFQRG